MSVVPSRPGTVVAAALLTLAAAPVLPAAPASAVAGRCPAGEGVTVVVDYGSLGGGVVTACDPDGGGKPAAQVVRDAGFSLEGVSSQPGFVCRVNGRPSADEGEDCADTPPADAYWGLFWSDGDPATWTYSSEGAGSLDVPDGGSIGWRFQDGGDRDTPGAPPTPAKKSPSPEPTPKPTPQPAKPPKSGDPTPTPTPSVPSPSRGGSSGPDPTAPSEPGGPGSGAPAGAGGGRATEKAKPATGNADRGDDKGDDRSARDGEKERKRPAGEDRTTEATPSDASPAVDALQPASAEPVSGDASSPVLTVVAGGAVLLLVGAAGVIAWRRRA